MHSHEALAGTLKTILRESVEVPENFRKRLDETIDKATAFATEVASREQNEDWARVAAGALYHLTSAVLMAWEASRSGSKARCCCREWSSSIASARKIRWRGATTDGHRARPILLLREQPLYPLARGGGFKGT